MAEILIVNGFDSAKLDAIPCADGGGRIDCYRLFDGVMAMRIHLETHGFCETRELHDGIEINFCAAGRFESSFSWLVCGCGKKDKDRRSAAKSNSGR